MVLSLLGSLLCLVLWIVLTFVRPVGLGIVHLFFGVSAVLWIRWWALKTVSGER